MSDYRKRTEYAWRADPEKKKFVETDLPETTVDVYERLSAVLLAVRSKLMSAQGGMVAIAKINKDAQKAGLPVDIKIAEESLRDRYEDGYRSSTLFLFCTPLNAPTGSPLELGTSTYRITIY